VGKLHNAINFDLASFHLKTYKEGEGICERLDEESKRIMVEDIHGNKVKQSNAVELRNIVRIFSKISDKQRKIDLAKRAYDIIVLALK
jgi:hypothetical protein